MSRNAQQKGTREIARMSTLAIARMANTVGPGACIQSSSSRWPRVTSSRAWPNSPRIARRLPSSHSTPGCSRPLHRASPSHVRMASGTGVVPASTAHARFHEPPARPVGSRSDRHGTGPGGRSPPSRTSVPPAGEPLPGRGRPEPARRGRRRASRLTSPPAMRWVASDVGSGPMKSWIDLRHGSAPQEVAFAGTQPVEASSEERVNRGWDRQFMLAL